MKLLFAVLFLLPSISAIKLGLINGRSEFFEPVKSGWEDTCAQQNITCLYRSSFGFPNDVGCSGLNIGFMQEFIDAGVDGVAFKDCGKDLTPIEMGEAAGIPVVTFDSDYNETARIAHIGTDDYTFGRTLARLLRQLRPEGGTFQTIRPRDGRFRGFVDEITKYNGLSTYGDWFDMGINTTYMELDEAMELCDVMEYVAQQNVSAMVFMTQTPMRRQCYPQMAARNRFRGITYIGTDGSDYQISYLNRQYVDGLVGQLPYEFGSRAVKVLQEYIKEGSLPTDFYAIGTVAYNLIPAELPELDENANLKGDLKYMGYVCFGWVASCAVGCIAWTVWNRSKVVVKAAQPIFLVMVAFGTLLVSAMLIPLTFDDNGNPTSVSDSYRTGICMSVPWLGFTGFTVTFSALFSKTWRVKRVFGSKTRHSRIQVTSRDALLPFSSLLLCNVAVLLIWTLKDPLKYNRYENLGTDYWNRVLSSYGVCRSDNAVPYLIPLAIFNFVAVCIAVWQAYEARHLTSVFAETTFIGLAVASIFQGFVTGIPVLVVVKDMPQAYYVILTLTVFLLCMAVLGLIFVPKILLQRKYSKMSEAQQKRFFTDNIIESDTRSGKLTLRAGNKYGSQENFSGTNSFKPPAVDQHEVVVEEIKSSDSLEEKKNDSV